MNTWRQEHPIDTTKLAERYHRVRTALPAHVRLIAVSKTRTVGEIKALYDLGQRDFGENYPQELRDKHPLLPPDIRWHFIGHLQRNKVKYVVPFVHLIHTVDSADLLDELEKRAAAAERTLDVLIQLRIAREETKYGMSEEDLGDLLRTWTTERWKHLRPIGLMGMASLSDDHHLVKAEFDGLARFQRTLIEEGIVNADIFREFSMGMSSDVDISLEAGSTMVRIGTAIFGERS